MTIAGRKGHLAIVDMKNLNLIKEFQVYTMIIGTVMLGHLEVLMQQVVLKNDCMIVVI